MIEYYDKEELELQISNVIICRAIVPMKEKETLLPYSGFQ